MGELAEHFPLERRRADPRARDDLRCHHGGHRSLRRLDDDRVRDDLRSRHPARVVVALGRRRNSRLRSRARARKRDSDRGRPYLVLCGDARNALDLLELRAPDDLGRDDFAL